MRRDMYEAGTVCRNEVTLHTSKGETFTWHEPVRYVFSRGPFPVLEGGDLGEAGPPREEFWYESLSDPMNAERFYTTEPLEEWY